MVLHGWCMVLHAVMTHTTHGLAPLPMQKSPEQEISLQLLLQPVLSPGIWREYGAPIAIDLSKHAAPPMHMDTAASPGFGEGQGAGAGVHKTPINLEWRKQGPYKSLVTIKVRGEGVEETTGRPACWQAVVRALEGVRR